VIQPAPGDEGKAWDRTDTGGTDIAILADLRISDTGDDPLDLRPFPRPQPIDTIGAVRQAAGRCDEMPSGRVADLHLAARLQAGDEPALAVAYERYAGLVFGVARRVLRDAALAEEVTQEVFTFLWEHPDRFDAGRGTMRSWLGVVAHRRSVDRVRAEVRRSRNESRVAAVEPVAREQSEVDDELTRTWVAGHVQEALEQLPPEQRDAIVLAYYGGRTFRQVAVELAIPEGTAKSRLRLGLAKLGDLLGSTLSDEEVAWT
jgi:RNA polymerase sigma-70 factor (ECF subfamily)